MLVGWERDIGLSPGELSACPSIPEHGFHTAYQQSMTINKQWDSLVHGTLGHAMAL